MTTSFPGKALRMLVESRSLPSDSTCILKDKPSKLDIKRHEPGILFISKVNKLIRSDQFPIAAKWSAINSTYLVCRSEFTSWYSLQTSH